ncbi:replication-relaxation family protein [Kitasatospora purpeofusca]|uniref:replication-relaxation family protein n=1 Tax=Kitasatospora purpeofusca TaxID=67352 RepID=UPI0036E5AD78
MLRAGSAVLGDGGESALGWRRKVRPDAVLEAPEIGVPVLMVEVDRSTMSSARVAAKFTAYRELFRTKSRDNDPALAAQESADRTASGWPGGTGPRPADAAFPDRTAPASPLDQVMSLELAVTKRTGT